MRLPRIAAVLLGLAGVAAGQSRQEGAQPQVCKQTPQIARAALDGEDVFWVRKDGTVAEQPLVKTMGLFSSPDANGVRQQIGPLTFQEGVGGYEGLPPRILYGVSGAIGVAAVQVIRYRTETRVGLFGITTSTTGLLGTSERVALLMGGGLAVWAPGKAAVTYSPQRVAGILGGASVVAIQDGRFLLSDGTVEDGVIERLEGDRTVLSGIDRGYGRGQTVLRLYPARSRAATPSFKYSWAKTGQPLRCIQQVERRLVLLEDGNVYLDRGGGEMDEDPLFRDVAQLTSSHSANDATAGLGVVKLDGTFLYGRDDWATLERVEIPGLGRIKKAWIAGQGATFESPAAAGWRYRFGAWLQTEDDQVLRWGEQVARAEMGAYEGTGPNPVSVDPWSGASSILDYNGQTLAVLPNANLEAWIAPSFSLATESAVSGHFLGIGDVGPQSLQVLDPATGSPETSLMSGSVVTSDRGLLSDRSRGVAITSIPVRPSGRAVLRIPTYKQGDQVTAKIRTFECGDGDSPPLCPELRYSPESYGWLSPVGGEQEPAEAASDTASPDPVIPSGGLAFLVYRTPRIFERQPETDLSSGGGDCAGYAFVDCKRTFRHVYLEVNYRSGGLDESYLEDLILVRPTDPCGREIDTKSLRPITLILEDARKGPNPFPGESLGESSGGGLSLAVDRLLNVWLRSLYEEGYTRESQVAAATCDLRTSARVAYAYMIAIQPLGFSKDGNKRFGQLIKETGLLDLVDQFGLFHQLDDIDQASKFVDRTDRWRSDAIKSAEADLDQLGEHRQRVIQTIEDWTAQDKQNPGSMGDALKRIIPWKEQLDDQYDRASKILNLTKTVDLTLNAFNKLNNAYTAYQWSAAVTQFTILQLTSDEEYDAEMLAFVNSMAGDFSRRAIDLGYSEQEALQGGQMLVDFFQKMGAENARSRAK